MRIDVSFDTATGRWHLNNVERIPVTPLVEELPAMWVSRDAAGAPAECLVTEEALQDPGGAVHAFLSEQFDVQPGGLDVVNRQSLAEIVVHRDPAENLPATLTIREPGIPYVHADGTVHVPTDDGDIRVTSSDSVLMIDLPVRATHEWVRVSDAGTGGLLALGRVQAIGTGFGANVTFGLDGGDIHITLTDTPLDPVADRRSRRVEWIDAVLADLKRRWWRHPLRGRAAARDAMVVAHALGDVERASAARRYARFIPVGFGLATFTAVAAVIIGASTFLPRTQPQLAINGPFTATYGFGADESVSVTADVLPDGTLTLMLSDKVTGTHDFGRDPSAPTEDDDSQSHLADCLAARNSWVAPRNIPTVSTTYTFSLHATGRDPVLLGTVTMASDASEMTTDPDACRSAVEDSDGSLVVRVLYRRSTEEFSLPPPGGIAESAAWTLTVQRVSDGSSGTEGSAPAPVTFRVD